MEAQSFVYCHHLCWVAVYLAEPANPLHVTLFHLVREQTYGAASLVVTSVYAQEGGGRETL